MLKSRWSPKGSFGVTAAARRTPSPDLNSNVRTQSIWLDISATLTIATAAAVRSLNGGSLLAMLSEIVLSDNGRDQVVISGMELLARNIADGTAGTGQRLATFATGPQVLRERVRIPLSEIWPLGNNPMETPYVQRDGNSVLRVEVNLTSLDAEGLIVVNGATGTSVLSGITVDVMQEDDPTGSGLPVALPFIVRGASVPVPGVLNNFEIPIRTPHTVRGLLIYGTTPNRGDVGDIIQSLALRTDRQDLIGPQLVNFADAVTWFSRTPLGADLADFGGPSGVAGQDAGGIYLWLDFLRFGSARLTNLLGPDAGTNLRLVANVAPTAEAGATSSSVNVLQFLLRRDAPGLVQPGASIEAVIRSRALLARGWPVGLFDFVSDVAGALPVVGGTISGALDAGGALVGTISGGQRSILSPCPGTPPGLGEAVAVRLRADPALADGLRTFIAGNPPPDKDFQQLRAVWGTTDGLASGAVWTAWGGGDCKTSSRETPLQNELRRIAALPAPSGTGGGLSLSTGAILGTDEPGGLSPALILGLVAVLAVGAFLGLRK